MITHGPTPRALRMWMLLERISDKDGENTKRLSEEGKEAVDKQIQTVNELYRAAGSWYDADEREVDVDAIDDPKSWPQAPVFRPGSTSKGCPPS